MQTTLKQASRKARVAHSPAGPAPTTRMLVRIFEDSMHLLGSEYALTGLALAGYRGHAIILHIKRRPRRTCTSSNSFTKIYMQVASCRGTSYAFQHLTGTTHP